MSETRRGRDVSCLALTFFYDYLETRNISRRVIQEGLPYSPEHLDHRTNWIDYGTFLEIERRMDALFKDPDLFFNIGRTFGATKGFGFLRVIFRSVVSPFQLYSRLPRLVGRFLFPFVTISFERLAEGTVRGTYRFSPDCPPSRAFCETVRGILTGIPAMLGEPPARVEMHARSPLEVVFDVETARSQGGLVAIRTLRRRLMKTGQMWWRNFGDVVTELEDTNHLLQEKVDALTDAKVELDRNVRDLSLLHAVMHAGTSERDPGLLLEKLVRLLSRELGDVPAAIFLPEGVPPQLVLGAAAGLDISLQERIATDPVLVSSLQGISGECLVRGAQLRVLPMTTRGRVVGTLLVDRAAGDRGNTFLETLANEIAVLLDNALSFRTITDLRDNLEVRVHERTAALEDAHEQLEDTVVRLRAADRSRNAFFTNVSHELRTPLTLILAPLDSIEETLAQAGVEVGEDLRSIRHNAQLLLRHINEILDFARLDADRMPMQLEDVELAPIVDDVIHTLRPLARARSIDISWLPGKGDGDAPLIVHADAKLLRRVLFNLVGNAIKYIDAGGAVEVHARRGPEGIQVEVADDGPGIAAEDRARIFERFERVADRRGRPIEGSGLGLAMVREIVERHRGTVTVGDRQGGGASFVVTLLEGSQEAATTPHQPKLSMETDSWLEGVASDTAITVESPRVQRGPAGAGRVLIVEDNAQMRAFLQRLLGAHYTVCWAEDGTAGLEAARGELPDLILSDVMMPGLDGYELCRRIKADPLTRNIPVLLISARHGGEAALDGFRAGADDYVVKPFSAPELLARVTAQLRIRAMTQALLRMERQTTLGTLAAGIAHEVLNPINAVINAVPPLRRVVHRGGGSAEANAAGMELLDLIDRGGHRVRQIVQTLLSLSRQTDARPMLKQVRLADAIEPILPLIQHRLGGNVRLHRDYDWNEPLQCAPELVGQVVLNLITNAADALGPQGGNIWLRTEARDGAVHLRVRDDGPGVPPELRDRIFDPFFTTKPPGSGTGVGLALSREFATLQQGHLELDASRRDGAEFVLSLPIDRGEQAGAEALH